MPFDKDSIRAALGPVVPAGAISRIAYCDGHASVRLAARGLSDAQRQSLKEQANSLIRAAASHAGEQIADVHLELTDDAPASSHPTSDVRHPTSPGHRPIPIPPSQQQGSNPLPHVKHVIAVGAGKGGVGKSTIAVNLAVGLARKGHSVGLMDGDIYGPSIPTMLGLAAAEVNVRGSMIQPFYVHGIKAMTIGKLVDPEKPLIWRGPMAHGAFKQLVEQTEWGELDYLIIDLPPGTGDVALTMAQLLKLTGAVIVCTPQQVALDDAVRALRMFQQLNIEVLGVVENMSYFVADDISPPRQYDIFGRGGAQKMAQRIGVPFLGAVPITVSLREYSDLGEPGSNFTRGTPLSAALEALVSNVESQAALAAVRLGRTAPTLSIS